jgi:pimeloyl-ACP methyl ester carboxylesterase
VLLRGLTREAAHWGALVPLLAQALPQDRILTLDLPGNGCLHAQASPWSVPAMAQACRNALAAQGVRGPVYLLAMSLGAMVATAWAHSAPAEVAGCVLINTSMRPFSPVHHRMQPHNWPTLARLLLWPHTPLHIERAVLRMTSNHPAAHADVLPTWVLARQQRPVRAANVLRQLAAAARYRAPPTAPLVPTLLLASTHDRLVRSQCSRAMAQAWHCPLVEHPGAGHDLPLDDPQWVVEQVCAGARRWEQTMQ